MTKHYDDVKLRHCYFVHHMATTRRLTMRTYKSYFALILIPYLVLIVTFHTQLQSFDNHNPSLTKDLLDGSPVADQHDSPTLIRKVKAIRNNLTHETHELVNNKTLILPPFERVRVPIVKGDQLVNQHRRHSIIDYDAKHLSRDDTWKVPPVDLQHNYALPFSAECRPVHRTVKSIQFQRLGRNFVYTAFYDNRISQRIRVRIIALLFKNDQPKLFCHFAETVGGQTKYHRSVPEFYEMCENHGKNFGGWILSCMVPYQLQDPPCTVIISSHAEYSTHNALESVRVPIFGLNHIYPQKENFGICIPPLFGYIPSTTLVEFIELSRLIGANKLVFYAFQTRRDIRRVLQHYERRGVVTVIPWDIPVSHENIWYYGQLLAINDCLYRNMNRFHYLAFNDIDEFIVPHGAGGKEWTSMILALNKMTNSIKDVQGHTQPYSGFIFDSAFFDPLVNEGGGSLYNLESDLRSKTFSRVRTKVMVQPDKIFELGIHHISRPVNVTYKPIYVPVSHGYLHHYRKCTTDYDHKMNCQVFVRDESISTYTPELRHNVHLTLWNLRTEFN